MWVRKWPRSVKGGRGAGGGCSLTRKATRTLQVGVLCWLRGGGCLGHIRPLQWLGGLGGHGVVGSVPPERSDPVPGMFRMLCPHELPQALGF